MLSTIAFYLACACLAFAVLFFLQLAIGARQLAYLRDYQPPPGEELPLVSIIVPARNEQREIEQALESLLNQDYPNLELLVVNDRSTDRTGEILQQMCERYPQLDVVHLTELPSGWLGKNHAMLHGAQRAKGSVLLFTDADVVMDPSTIRRAVGYLQEHEVDHLPMTPGVEMPTALLEAFVVTFTIFFGAYVRTWKVSDPKSKAHVGIGAFNMIRADVYREIGTHEAIRMRPDDDLKLGKLVKKNGFRQELVYGQDLINVRWYSSLAELIEGLMKNAFSGADYRVSVVLLATVAIFGLLLWPFVAVFVTSGVTRWLYAGAVAVLLLLYIDAARALRLRWWPALLFPLCLLLFVYIQWRAMLLTFASGGIRWRDTHYPLSELKANKV